MRRAALLGVHELAQQDERVVFIGSDITKRDVEAFERDFPDRFFMEGIYEAHIIGMAAGLAMCGRVPYINTIATFLTRRCYEQLSIDVCLHDLPVRLLASGGGTVYAPLGPTHLATDDIALMRALPNMTVVAPCDADEMRRLLPTTLDWPGPMYIRLAKGGDRIVSSDEHPFAIGHAIPLRLGEDVLIVSTGVTTQVALDAAAKLESDGIGATVLHVHTLKPFDADAVLAHAQGVDAVVTLEEHSLIGGLGGVVAETLLEGGRGAVRFARLGLPDHFLHELGSQNQIMEHHGLADANVAARVRGLLASDSDSAKGRTWARS